MSSKIPPELNDAVEGDLGLLIKKYPFFALSLMKLKLVGSTTSIAYVSPKTLGINSTKGPFGYLGFSKRTRLTILAHESLHVLLMHFREDKNTYPNHFLRNVCMDVIINRTLLELDNSLFYFKELEPFGIALDLYDKSGFTFSHKEYKNIPDFLNLDWMGVYKWIVKNGFEKDFTEDKCTLFCDLDLDEIDLSDVEILDQEVKDIIDIFGDKLPIGVQNKFWDLYAPKVDWKEYLRNCVNTYAIETDYTYVNNSRRQHIAILPTLNSSPSAEIFVILDTSGSMSDKTISEVLAECRGLCDLHKTSMTFITCDHEVTDVRTIKSGEPFDWERAEIKGRRCTSFIPAFKKVDELSSKEKKQTVFFFTDTMGAFPDKEPSYPVVFFTDYKEAKVPFGTLVQM